MGHQGRRTCDPWFENETPWHRDWKRPFSKDWREFVQYSESGEKHIADVKTDLGTVLEIQHEQTAREQFYRKMVWIVNGLRRHRDRPQFFAAVERGASVCHRPQIVSVRWREGALLRDWGESRVPVYFDFREPVLWRLNPSRSHGVSYLATVTKAEFLRVHLEGEPFEETFAKTIEEIAEYHLTRHVPEPLSGFERYMARQQRTRPRF